MHENSSERTSHQGGTAPAERQCRYVKADGKPCRDWSIRGQDYCHRHDIFIHARVERPIDVPLLENQAAVVLLLSETLRSLAWGTIPVSNGRMMLEGCRLAHTIQCKDIEMARLRIRARRMGMSEEELFGTAEEKEAENREASAKPSLKPSLKPSERASEDPSQKASEEASLNPSLSPSEEPSQNEEQGVESGAPDAERESAPSTVSPERCEEPLTTPLMQPPDQSRRRFRDLKKNWDKELCKAGNEMSEMWSPRYGETREDFNASRATPFEHLEAEDRELERIRAEAKALVEAHALAEAQAAQAVAEACLPAC